VSPAVARQSGRLVARSAHISVGPPRPSAGVARGSQVSRCDVLEYLFLQQQFSNQLLQPIVLALQLLQASGLVDVQAAVFLPIPVVALFRYPGFLAG
jgi:hypothetical protein